MDGSERLVKGPISTVIEPGLDIIHHGDKLSPEEKGRGAGRGTRMPCFPGIRWIENIRMSLDRRFFFLAQFAVNHFR